MAAPNRAVRLVALMRLLDDRCYTTDELAEEFGVSARTIRRDLLDLQGEPLFYPLTTKVIWQSLRLACMKGVRDRS